MKAAELKELSLEELREQLQGEKETLKRLRFAHAVSPLENPMRMRHTRKAIARINTIIHQKQQTQ